MQHATHLDHRLRVERLVTEVQRDLTRPVSLGEMGEIAAMSPFHLTRVVRQVTGLTPVALLGAHRLQEAKRLLLTTDATVTDACFAVGFSSLGSFSSRFTGAVGVTPSAFKRSPAIVDGHADQIAAMIASSPEAALPAPGLSGRVFADDVGDGLIFLGLFPGGIAQGYPVCGDVLRRPGRFLIPNVPDGVWTLLVACLPEARSAVDWVMPNNETRVGIVESIVVKDGKAAAPVEVRLRRRSPIDPPVLLSLMATPHIVGMVKTKFHRLATA